MTDRAAALRALADAVEGDDWAKLTLMDFEPLVAASDAILAYLARMSLDTCATLQAEVLPGVEAYFRIGPDGCGASIKTSPEEYVEGTAPTLPRAWLAAQLRALAAKEA